MRSEVLEGVEGWQRIQGNPDVDDHRLGSFEVRQRTVEITDGPEPEGVPEEWAGYQGRTPIFANVCSNDQVLPTVSIVAENHEQELWRESVDGRARVPNRPNHL